MAKTVTVAHTRITGATVTATATVTVTVTATAIATVAARQRGTAVVVATEPPRCGWVGILGVNSRGRRAAATQEREILSAWGDEGGDVRDLGLEVCVIVIS
jgi:hypothetical protein